MFALGLKVASTAIAAFVAAAPPLSHPRVLVHLDLARGQQPENIVAEPDGSADLTFAWTGQVARVTRAGQVRVIAQVPVPPNGDVPVVHKKIFMGGIVRTRTGVLYVAVSTGRAAGTGVYRIRRGHAPIRIGVLPPGRAGGAFLNGMALDEATGRLYVADSFQGTVWSLPARGGVLAAWATGTELSAPPGGFGANGLKLRDHSVWVSNSAAGKLIRIPISRHGVPGRPRVAARGLGPIDDFAFAGRTVIAAINQDNKVVAISPNGTVTTTLTAPDGLSNPTSVAVRGRTVYITDGAYFTGRDPNVLRAELDSA